MPSALKKAAKVSAYRSPFVLMPQVEMKAKGMSESESENRSMNRLDSSLDNLFEEPEEESGGDEGGKAGLIQARG